MKIKVIYLARLSEDIGKKEEYIDLLESKQTIKDVYLKLELDKINYEIYSARNFEHSVFEDFVEDNDEIAFFPTITGG
ncbi:MoaD/ThiS family protein [Gammaproteobacteria bacterium]|jgi:molybdopterin converting factor small subunit|nr:MoaD/ThiS family protein [Gammaproteobacteria bacterium]|tara:strand:- start:2575 stop:2808 length:234 start_codon:yes stop_codon:yes gene_type:complete